MTDEELRQKVERLRFRSVRASDAYFAAKRELEDRVEARMTTAQKYERDRASLRTFEHLRQSFGKEPTGMTVSQFRATIGSTSF